MYRHLRRREYQRQDFMDAMAEKVSTALYNSPLPPAVCCSLQICVFFESHVQIIPLSEESVGVCDPWCLCQY